MEKDRAEEDKSTATQPVIKMVEIRNSQVGAAIRVSWKYWASLPTRQAGESKE